jgi:hypothetical protein
MKVHNILRLRGRNYKHYTSYEMNIMWSEKVYRRFGAGPVCKIEHLLPIWPYDLRRADDMSLAFLIFPFAAQPQEIFLNGLKKLEHRSHKCLELRGNI